MAYDYAQNRPSQLWQVPVFLAALALFGYAGYRFIDPKPGLTVEQQMAQARKLLDAERPEAALAVCNRLIAAQSAEPKQDGAIRLMIAECIDDWQKAEHKSIGTNHLRIIEQSRLAIARGAEASAGQYRRLAESYEAIGKVSPALENYRKAMDLDPERQLRLQRKVIEMQLAADQTPAAQATIENFLDDKTLTAAERSWATAKKATILTDAHQFEPARALLQEAINLEDDPVAIGQLNYSLGYCYWKLGDPAEADRVLRLARDGLKPTHPLDADACYVLGKIAEDKGDARTALSFYEIVLTNQPGAESAALCQLGRGVCRIMLGQDDAGLTDLKAVVDEIGVKPARAKDRDGTVAGLQTCSRMLAGRANFEGALELLAYEQTLVPEPAAEFYARLGDVYAKRADEQDVQLNKLAGAELIQRQQQARENRSHAADAFIACSRALTVADDRGYADSLWKAIDLYDRAGNVQSAIAALEVFVNERPEDPLTPDALLRLGQTYQLAGLFDKAIKSFNDNQLRYPQSLAASKSAVPLALAYVAKGPSYYGKAESTLLGVLADNNLIITPASQEFRQALFELAQLYYRTSRYVEAISRLDEFTKRYPDDDRAGQLLFLRADSYRRDARAMEKSPANKEANASDRPAIDPAVLAAAKRDRLTKAKSLFDATIEQYKKTPPTSELEKAYLKVSHFYRADCVYDLGQYADSIPLYDSAAFRYQDDPAALGAYVQIYNAYNALGKPEDAKAANERAKWLLRRMPADAFKDGAFPMPKEYWEATLKWSSEAGS